MEALLVLFGGLVSLGSVWATQHWAHRNAREIEDITLRREKLEMIGLLADQMGAHCRSVARKLLPIAVGEITNDMGVWDEAAKASPIGRLRVLISLFLPTAKAHVEEIALLERKLMGCILDMRDVATAPKSAENNQKGAKLGQLAGDICQSIERACSAILDEIAACYPKSSVPLN